MGDHVAGDDVFPPWVLFDSLKPLVRTLRDKDVVLRRTASSPAEWTRPAVDQLVTLFRKLGIGIHDETGVTTGPVSGGHHYILLHGGEGAGREKGAFMYAGLPPNRLVILVKSKRVLALEGLNSKDHVRIKIDCRNQESMEEVVRRIVVLLGAQRVVADAHDCVKWNEVPEMVVVKKERNVSLGLSITTRQVDVSNHCRQIVLIKRIERYDGKLDRLKRYMHIQSVNGILLDDLDCEAASKKIRDISEGQVFLMVRAAHRDTEKAAQSPMVTQLGTPSLRSPLSIWKGVCRFNANPFMLTWVEKEVLVVVRSNQVQLIPALIMEPKDTPRKVAIVSYISPEVAIPQAADPRGHLVAAVGDQSTVDKMPALGKSPDFVMSMINRCKEEGATLALYLCQDGPKHLSEQTYSECISTVHSRRRPEEEEDLGFEDPEEQMLNPVIPSNHPYSPVYITGSITSDSSRLYEMMTRGESTAVHPISCGDNPHYAPVQRHFSNGLFEKEGPITLETPSPGIQFNLLGAGQQASRELSLLPKAMSEASLLSPNSPVTVDAGESGSESSSLTSRSSMDRGHSVSLAGGHTPPLLSSQLFDTKWSRVSTACMTSEDGRHSATPLCKYMLQNLDSRKLEEEKLSLCPSLELLYVKPNTICVYTINMEQLSDTPHEVFTKMCDFLSMFQSLRKPPGMQVILAAVYDSTSEYGKTVCSGPCAWFCERIPMALKSKFNEILHEDDADRIAVVPVDLAGGDRSAKQMQTVISECVDRYHQRLEGIDRDTEKMPLQQWPLFRQKVVELARLWPVVAWEKLTDLARQFLWIEDGELFEHCLAALEQSTSLWLCPGPADKKAEGFLVNPDVVVSIISRLADPELRKMIRAKRGKAAADLCNHSFATQKALRMMVNDVQLSNQASHLIPWMQKIGLLFEGSGAAVSDPCYFIPSITTSIQWTEAHGQQLADFSEGSAELFIDLCKSSARNPPVPSHFFYQFVAHIVSTQSIDASNLSVGPGCTRVKIASLKLNGFTHCEAILSFDTLQCIIRIQLQPWQGAIIPTAHSYFRKVLQDCEKTYMWKDVGEAIMGPAFRNPYAESNARCAELFSFLNEALSQPRPSSPATYVVNAESLKEMSDSGIEPQLSIKNIRGGKYEHFKVSDIEGLNQWIYDPTLLYETKDGDVKRMQAMNKVAEWLLQDPQICCYIACENGIIRDQDPEAHNWSTNTGPVPAGYRLIQQWRARKLPISRLRDALIKHHHNAAARCLQPFCDGMPYTEV